MSEQAEALLAEIRGCRVCADFLPAGPRPIVQFSASAKILIIGQAPGSKVHLSGVPWADESGERLRAWTGLPSPVFYDPEQVALAPMGFCYPGKGTSGDLPPRPECAPLARARPGAAAAGSPHPAGRDLRAGALPALAAEAQHDRSRAGLSGLRRLGGRPAASGLAQRAVDAEESVV